MNTPDDVVLTSAANFFVGEVIRLRVEDGGGTWLVIALLPRRDGFARAVATWVGPGREKS